MVNNNFVEQFRSNGWDFPEHEWDKLSVYEKSFINLELGNKRSLDTYKNRLKAIQFMNMDNVLDAACGVGQWSIALSDLNQKVFGIDLMSDRINTAKIFSDTMKKRNISFNQSPLERIPFENNFFDGCFCYGAFMFTQTNKTIKELYRVLKPGGKLYVNANDIGWYLYLLFDRGIKKRNFSIIKQSIKFFIRTFLGYDQNVIFFKKRFISCVENNGFKIIQSGKEGNINLTNSNNTFPFYDESYFGLPNINELLIEKII